ncbi:MAG: blaR1 4 [Phycisphaerales bacterium]|nr:blaR1 4 [Phycisphaerales bacterium]
MLADFAATMSRQGTTLLPLLFEAALKGTVLILLGWLLLCAHRRMPAATRHWVCFLALLSLLLLPIFARIVPGRGVLPRWAVLHQHHRETAQAPHVIQESAPPPAGPTAQLRGVDAPGNSPAHDVVPAPGDIHSKTSVAMHAEQSSQTIRRDPLLAHGSGREGFRKPQVSGRDELLTAPASGAMSAPQFDNPEKSVGLGAWGWGMLAWAIGLTFVCVPTIWGAITLEWLRHSAKVIRNPLIVARAAQMSAQLGLRHRVLLLERADAMPMTWGIYRPCILLPTQAASWSGERLRAVLLHELGHIKRWDCLIEWIARAVLAAYWFHPLAWLTARRLREARESACDDLVLCCGYASPRYAEDLLHLATHTRRAATLVRPSLPMARVSQVEQRVRAILDETANRKPLTWVAGSLFAIGMLGFVLPLAMVHAQADRSSPQANRPAIPARESSRVAASQPATSQPAAAQPPTSQPDGEVATQHLRVLDESNQPIANAKVWVAKDYPSFPVCLPDGQTLNEGAESKPDGSAEWKWPRNVKTNFVVRAEGFVPAFIRGVSLTDAPYTIHLTKGQPITGIVRRPNGEPIPHARLKAVQEKFLLDFIPDFALTGTTDKDGRFTLQNAAAARYTVAAVVEDATPPVYTEPMAVDVPVDRSPAPLQMVAMPGASLKGRFVTTQDIKLDGREASFWLRLPREVRREIHTAPDGSFTVDGIPPNALGMVAFLDVGSYIAVLDWEHHPASCEVTMSSVRFSGLTPGVYDGITVHLYKPAIYAGTFRDEQGKPFEKLGVVIEPWNRIFDTDSNGRVSARMPPNVNVTIRYLNSDRKVETLRAAEGETIQRQITTPRPPEPVLDRELAGQVVDEHGAPISGAKVHLANHGIVPQQNLAEHDPKPTWQWGTLFAAVTTADEHGQFKFNLLTGGTTDVWAEVEGARWAVLRDVDSNAKGQKLVLRRVQALPTFTGSVSDADGRPAAGVHACLFCYDNGDIDLLGETRTNAEGRFELKLTSLSPGHNREVRLICRSNAGDTAWKVLPRCGMEGIQIQFKPQASVRGRLVNQRGEPLASARVWLYYGQDPVMGNMQFYSGAEKMSPMTTTDASGQFNLRGLPRGSTVSVFAKHPEYDRAEVWYVKDVQQDTKIADMEAKDGVTIEGAVRYADGHPAVGATVTLNGMNRAAIATATTDSAGAYRMTGLEHQGLRMSNLSASVGIGPEWEGRSDVATTHLYSGDHARDVDVVLQRSFASRQKEWRAEKGTAAASRYRMAVVDDADPATEGKTTYDDKLALYDSDGKRLWEHGGLGVAWGHAPVACAPADRSTYVYEYLSRRISKFNDEGKLLWQSEKYEGGRSVNSLAVDHENGDVWALTSAGTIYGSSIIVYDRDGKKRLEVPIAGAVIAYSPHDRCFWVTGKRLMKISREGKVLVEPSISFAWVSRELAVNPADGSVWVTEESHPEVHDSHNRLYVISPDGQVLTQRDLGKREPGRIVLDAPRGVAWVCLSKALAKMTLDGKTLREIPTVGDLALEPDTGCVWIANAVEICRLAPDGKLIWSQSSASNTVKTLLVVGP